MTNTAAIVVEDEPIHEIYSCLIGKPISPQFSAAVCYEAKGRAAASGSTSPVIGSCRRGNHRNSHNRGEATVIPLDNHGNCSKEPTSQFMKFYQKSCRSQEQCSGGIVDTRNRRADRTKDPYSKDTSPSSQIKSNRGIKVNNPKTQQPIIETTKSHTQSTGTTKSERRRTAKRERERQIHTDKRIRFMLHSDFSEHDYELLYNGLNR
ncbi:hypothetical protein ACHAWU_008160 [Discostella pseudostelligera]|uniref:Uncharacterized protein n=1 Tax=Discostella pseudostelligera TaxID=259834 RepID=A0ABD3MJV7_9STRA